MTLRDAITSDVSTIFLNVNDFAETVVYYFAGGGSKTIKAIIDRSTYSFYDAAGNVVMPAFRITINNHCELGVLASKVNTGGDEVALIDEYGAVIPERVTVISITNQDQGTLELALM